MARPLKDSNEVSAKERVKQAFWQLLEEKPLARITVDDLTKRARCNRGTFYYHYETIDSMALQLADECFVPELFTLLLAQIDKTESPLGLMQNDAIRNLHIRHMFMLLGNQGSPALVEYIKEMIASTWAEGLGAAGGLSPQQRMLFEFAVGGYIGIFTAQMHSKGAVDLMEVIDILPEKLPAILFEASLAEK